VIGVWSDRPVVQLKRGGVALFLCEVGGREFQGGWGLDVGTGRVLRPFPVALSALSPFGLWCLERGSSANGHGPASCALCGRCS
jgi:hypothetical protein